MPQCARMSLCWSKHKLLCCGLLLWPLNSTASTLSSFLGCSVFLRTLAVFEQAHNLFATRSICIQCVYVHSKTTKANLKWCKRATEILLLWLLIHKSHHIKTALLCKIIIKSSYLPAQPYRMAVFPLMLLFDALAKLDCTLNTRSMHAQVSKYFDFALDFMPIKTQRR